MCSYSDKLYVHTLYTVPSAAPLNATLEATGASVSRILILVS